MARQKKDFDPATQSESAIITSWYFNPESIKARYPFEIVARTKVRELTGGAVSEKTMANLDNSGAGPSGAFRVGGKVVYPIDSFIAWLEARSRPVEKRTKKTPDVLQ